MSESTAHHDWAKNIHVRVALAAAGEPDGTRLWQETFARALLASVDNTSELDIEDMLAAVATWNWHLREQFSKYCETLAGVRARKNPLAAMPAEIPRMLLTRQVAGRTMDFDHCAWLLQVTVDELERVLWGRTEVALSTLREAAADVLAGRTKVASSGAKAQRLREYLRLRHGWVSTDRFSIQPHVIDAALRRIEEAAVPPITVFRNMQDEGAIPMGVHYRTFTRRIAQARKQLVAA